MTVTEIKEKLTKLGVKFDEKNTKPELLELLEKQTKKEKNLLDETQEGTSEDNKNDAQDDSDDEEPEQKKYVVIHDFKDLKDNDTIYIKDDIYPRRANSIIDEARVKELMSSDNKIGEPLIKEQD